MVRTSIKYLPRVWTSSFADNGCSHILSETGRKNIRRCRQRDPRHKRDTWGMLSVCHSKTCDVLIPKLSSYVCHLFTYWHTSSPEVLITWEHLPISHPLGDVWQCFDAICTIRRFNRLNRRILFHLCFDIHVTADASNWIGGTIEACSLIYMMAERCARQPWYF